MMGPRVTLAFALCAIAVLAQDAPEVKLDGDDVPKGKPCSSGKKGCLEFEWGEYQGEVTVSADVVAVDVTATSELRLAMAALTPARSARGAARRTAGPGSSRMACRGAVRPHGFA